MLWVEMEVNSGAVKHMVELIWCVDEVDDTTLADLHDIWWFWWRYKRATFIWNGGWYLDQMWPATCSRAVHDTYTPRGGVGSTAMAA